MPYIVKYYYVSPVSPDYSALIYKVSIQNFYNDIQGIIYFIMQYSNAKNSQFLRKQELIFRTIDLKH